MSELHQQNMQRVVRAAKASSAALSAMADATKNVGEAAARLRKRREGAPPPSWEVEREKFVRDLNREP